MKQHTKHVILIAVFVVLLVSLMAVHPLAAQDAMQNPSMEEANKLFQAQNWEKASQAYEAITTREPANALAWLQLGLTRHSLQQYERAVAAYEQAEKLQFALPRTRYNLACAYSLMNQKEKAFAWLDKALAANLGWVEMLKTDTDLANLRDDPRFETVLEQADKNARPCVYDPVHWQFDFWVGEWDVFTAQGQNAGTNSIQKTENGCLILENWTSTLSGTGKSMNYYDPSIGKWRQNWVDSHGGMSSFDGEFRDGAMHFQGENINREGNKESSRMTFTPLPNGRVRQLIEQSKDGGKTWSVYFDGVYVRKP